MSIESAYQPEFFRVVEHQRPLGFTAAAVPPRRLSDKHRPATLDGIVGQPHVVERLGRFAAAPYPAAFLLHGDTGVGKTSTALALASELGAHPEWGVTRIDSGLMDADAVERVCREMRFAPMFGSWRVIVVDEADTMSIKARLLWLSALEELTGRNVIVFTTNHPDKIEQRFRDRCEELAFDSAESTLGFAADALIARVWTAEGRPGPAPAARDLANVTIGGRISLRRAVNAVESPKLRTPPSAPVPTPAPPTPEADSPRRLAALKAVATRRANLAARSAVAVDV